MPSPEKVVSSAPSIVKRASANVLVSTPPTTTILPSAWIATAIGRRAERRDVGRLLAVTAERRVGRAVGVVARDAEVAVVLARQQDGTCDDDPAVGLDATLVAASNRLPKSVVWRPSPLNDVSGEPLALKRATMKSPPDSPATTSLPSAWSAIASAKFPPCRRDAVPCRRRDRGRRARTRQTRGKALRSLHLRRRWENRQPPAKRTPRPADPSAFHASNLVDPEPRSTVSERKRKSQTVRPAPHATGSATFSDSAGAVRFGSGFGAPMSFCA